MNPVPWVLLVVRAQLVFRVHKVPPVQEVTQVLRVPLAPLDPLDHKVLLAQLVCEAKKVLLEKMVLLVLL